MKDIINSKNISLMNSEDTILNQQQNDNEETLPNNDQSTAKEQPAKKTVHGNM